MSGNDCHKSGYANSGCDVLCPPEPINFPNCQGVQPVLQNSDCGPCCWDMSLCTQCPTSCSSRGAKVNIVIEDTTDVPVISNDAGAYLAIHNYSLQRFITRTLKFVTAYYDFVGGMINSTVNSTNINNVYRECCDGDANTTIPSPAYPASVKDRVFSAWQWVWSRLESTDSFDLFCEPDCLLQPVLTLLTLAGGDSSSNFRNSLLKRSLINVSNFAPGCTNQTTCGAFCDPEACAVTVGTSGCGKDYDDSQFFNWCNEVLGVIEIMETILNSLDLYDSPLEAEQLLFKICDCYIKCACCDSNNQPNPKCLDVSALNCFNRCGEPYNGQKFTTGDTSVAEIVRNTYGGCESCLTSDEKYRPGDLSASVGAGQSLQFGENSETEDCCLPGSINCNNDAFDGKLFVPNTKERLQAAIFVLDWLAFLLFDRDADSSQFSNTSVGGDNCYCPGWEGEADGNQGYSDATWLKRRCKLGTGNGNCVVAAGACRQFRTSDDYVPLQNMLISLKHFFSQLAVQPGEGYQNSITNNYNNLMVRLHDVHLGDGDLTFHVDCAAPQFCCTTNWTQIGRKISNVTNNCNNTCACCNLTVPEYTVQCFARMKCSCLGPLCKQCPTKQDTCITPTVNVNVNKV